jgi:hypothetical protein
MAKEEQEKIKEADLTNNCPECFNQELKLTFYQKHLRTRFYHKTTSELSHEIKCLTCGSVIYPVTWTEDIERSFDYFQKLAEPQPAGIRLTGFTLWLISFLLVLSGAAVYLYYSGILRDWL